MWGRHVNVDMGDPQMCNLKRAQEITGRPHGLQVAQVDSYHLKPSPTVRPFGLLATSQARTLARLAALVGPAEWRTQAAKPARLGKPRNLDERRRIVV